MHYAQHLTDNLNQKFYTVEEIVEESGFNPILHILPTLVDQTIVGVLRAMISSGVQLS